MPIAHVQTLTSVICIYHLLRGWSARPTIEGNHVSRVHCITVVFYCQEISSKKKVTWKKEYLLKKFLIKRDIYQKSMLKNKISFKKVSFKNISFKHGQILNRQHFPIFSPRPIFSYIIICWEAGSSGPLSKASMWVGYRVLGCFLLPGNIF